MQQRTLLRLHEEWKDLRQNQPLALRLQLEHKVNSDNYLAHAQWAK
jgi:hypothetical protein